jgi:hypothetical protein
MIMTVPGMAITWQGIEPDIHDLIHDGPLSGDSLLQAAVGWGHQDVTVTSSPVYTSVIGELESNVGALSGSNCQWLFTNHHLVWRNLDVHTQSGTNVTPGTLSYYDTGVNDIEPSQAVWIASNMITTINTASGETAADTTWSGGCTSWAP